LYSQYGAATCVQKEKIGTVIIQIIDALNAIKFSDPTLLVKTIDERIIFDLNKELYLIL
jgi:hypothetical protein